MAAVCREVQELCKRAGEKPLRGFDLTSFCSRYRRNTTYFDVGDVARPLPIAEGGVVGAFGFELECTQAGQTGETEPAYKSRVGAVIRDGGVLWLVRAISVDSLERTITGVVWDAAAPMSVEGEIVDALGPVQAIAARHVGGTVGGSHLVVASVTFSDDSVEHFGIQWSID